MRFALLAASQTPQAYFTIATQRTTLVSAPPFGNLPCVDYHPPPPPLQVIEMLADLATTIGAVGYTSNTQTYIADAWGALVDLQVRRRWWKWCCCW